VESSTRNKAISSTMAFVTSHYERRKRPVRLSLSVTEAKEIIKSLHSVEERWHDLLDRPMHGLKDCNILIKHGYSTFG
jgi:hypothetical protein